MLDCDLTYPVIVSRDGGATDGMHRIICKALLEGREYVEAVRLLEDPGPDFVGLNPMTYRIEVRWATPNPAFNHPRAIKAVRLDADPGLSRVLRRVPGAER